MLTLVYLAVLIVLYQDVWLPMLTLLNMDILDTTGTMYPWWYGGFTDGAGGFDSKYHTFLVDT
jgi:AGZA family xanthine/uracil permease-like MFS transporter